VYVYAIRMNFEIKVVDVEKCGLIFKSNVLVLFDFMCLGSNAVGHMQ